MKHTARVAVIFPLFVMAGWLVKLHWVKTHGTAVTFAVTGFDPRDPLSGHYLSYTIDYGAIAKCPDPTDQGNGDVCFCLAPAPGGNYVTTWAGYCWNRNPETCSVFIKGTCTQRGFTANIERVYFPERFTKELERVPQKSVIKVRLASDGQGQVTQLLVDGVDMLEFAKTIQKP